MQPHHPMLINRMNDVSRVLVAMLAVGLILAACAPAAAPQPPMAEEGPAEAAAGEASDGEVAPPADIRCMIREGNMDSRGEILQDGECFFANQLLLSGAEANIDALLEEFNLVPSEFNEETDVINLAEVLPDDDNLFPSFLYDDNPQIRLLTFEENITLGLMHNAEFIAANMENNVLAEPNYIVGLAASCSSAVEGLPHSVGAHPHSVGAHPYSNPGGVSGPGGFLRQWAFGLQPGGIELYTQEADSNPERTAPNYLGRNTQVVIFDTSPYDSDGNKKIDMPVPGSDDAIFDLYVEHPLLARNIVHSDDPERKWANHGLFVAGLVHAIAPEADVSLVRVLNEHGLGDLHSVAVAMFKYAEAHSGDLDDTIVNLSLGSASPCAIFDEENVDLLLSLFASFGYANDNPDWMPLVTLHTMSNILHARGATLVAAAGNSSAGRTPPYTSSMPALFDRVVSVMAGDLDGARACYSNLGTLSAPGGDSIKKHDNGTETCDPAAVTTCSVPGCTAGVISIVRNPDAEGNESNSDEENAEVPDYAFWAGTSFAAPMVAGVCALIQGISKTDEEPGEGLAGDCRSLTGLKEISCDTGTGIPTVNVRAATGQRADVCPDPE